MEHLKQTFAYQLEYLEIIRPKFCLISFLKSEIEVDLARDMIFFRVPCFEFVPSFNSPILMKYVWVDFHEAQERFVVSTVVDVDAYFRMFPKDITVQSISKKQKMYTMRDAYNIAS